jgi:hypothetical protein
MLSEGKNSDEEPSELSPEIAIPRIVRFWIILPFYILSLICSLFVLYYFIFNRTLRQALHNHVIIIFIFINFVVQITSIPWVLHYYRVGYVPSHTPSFCLTWQFIDEGLYITTTVLFAWATIERHILIFHDRLVATQCKFILVHCLPIVIIVLYSICYNTIVIIFPPCPNAFDYSQIVCGYPLCYYDINHGVAIWDVIVNDMIPTIIIIVCSIALLFRIIYQKHRIGRPIRWRNHRKMTIQLLSISVLYLVIYIPKMLMEFIYLCGVSEDVGEDFMMYADFIKHYGNLLLPFICAGSMPKLNTKIKKMFPCCRRPMRSVRPETMTVSCRVDGGQMKTNSSVS